MLAVVAAYGIFVYARYQEQTSVSYLFRVGGSDSGFLCEWHYPATNGVPGYVVVCYHTAVATQCYRIEDNRVTDYHMDMEIRLGPEINRIRDSGKWRTIPSLSQEEKDFFPEEFDLHYQSKWRSHAALELAALMRPFEMDGAGYVAHPPAGQDARTALVQPVKRYEVLPTPTQGFGTGGRG